jgi:hypothetical protein
VKKSGLAEKIELVICSPLLRYSCVLTFFVRALHHLVSFLMFCEMVLFTIEIALLRSKKNLSY